MGTNEVLKERNEVPLLESTRLKVLCMCFLSTSVVWEFSSCFFVIARFILLSDRHPTTRTPIQSYTQRRAFWINSNSTGRRSGTGFKVDLAWLTSFYDNHCAEINPFKFPFLGTERDGERFCLALLPLFHLFYYVLLCFHVPLSRDLQSSLLFLSHTSIHSHRWWSSHPQMLTSSDLPPKSYPLFPSLNLLTPFPSPT